MFKRRFRLDIRKYVFGNRVIDNWNSLPTLQDVLIVKLLILLRSTSRLYRTGVGSCLDFKLVIVIVGNIWRKPVPTHASIDRGIAGVGEFSEFGE